MGYLWDHRFVLGASLCTVAYPRMLIDGRIMVILVIMYYIPSYMAI